MIKIFDIATLFEPILVNSISKKSFDVIIRDNILFAIGDSGVFSYELNPSIITDIKLVSEVKF